MRTRRLGIFAGLGLLLLALALAARSAAPVGAVPLPQTRQPRTAHVALEMRLTGDNKATGETFAMTATGAGDADTAREAMQLRYEMKVSGNFGGGQVPESMVAEMALVDGRLYFRDPTTQEWTWTALPTGGAEAFQLVPDFGAFGGDQLDFTVVGPEMIDGVATTHYRAKFDLVEVLGGGALPSPAPGEPAMPEMLMSVDLWIGTADGYVHRYATAMQFSAAEERGGFSSIAMTQTVAYSKFDQPVAITAPAGARPASSGAGTGTAGGFLPSLGGLPLGGATLGLPGGGTTLAGTFPTLGGGTTAPGGANPSPTPRRSVPAPSAQPSATATPKPAPTSTRAVTPTVVPPTAAPPTATVGVAANAALPPSVAPQPAAAATTAQQPVAQARGSSLPLVLGAAGLIALLGAAGGLIVAGRRLGGR